MPLPPHKHLNLKVVNCRRDAFFAGASKYRECCRDRLSVGAGIQWSTVYPSMEAAKIRIIGGRSVGTRVRGLTLE